MDDASGWGEHLSEWEFDELTGDLHSWAADLKGILTDILEAADGTVDFASGVSDDILGWVTEYGDDLRAIRDGTYDGHELAQTEIIPGVVPAAFTYGITQVLRHYFDEYYGSGIRAVEP